MSDPQMVDMAVLRSKLLAAQARLRDDEPGEALALITDSITLLTPRLDPEARHPSVEKGVMGTAIRAAHDALLKAGMQNPVELLIVQTHDDAGKTTGRALATSAANPQDILRVVLDSVRQQL